MGGGKWWLGAHFRYSAMPSHRFFRLLLVVCMCVFAADAAAGAAVVGGAPGRDSSGGRWAAPDEPLAQTFLVSEPSDAACLDGSLPRYWLQPATVPADANRWAVHLQGGGWW